MTYVLDACALIALLNAEDGALNVKALFEQAHAGKHRLAMSIVNLLEVYYGYIRDKGRDEAREILKPIHDTPLEVIAAISPFVYEEASRLKGVYRKISLADSVGIATAAEFSGYFVTSDHHELEAVQRQEPVKFCWFR